MTRKIIKVRDGIYTRGKFRNVPKAEKLAWLHELGITHVVCLVTPDPDLVEADAEGELTYVRLPMADSHVVNQDAIFLAAQHVVSAVRNSGRVLVHCNQGRNRTGVVVARALMTLDGISADEAIERFRNARPNGLANEHFVEYLRGLTIHDS